MNMNPKSSKVVLVCAFGLLAAFFMPWLQFFGIGVSGYSLGRIGSYGNYAWIIPILAGATIVITYSGLNNRNIGALSGIVPLSAVSYGFLRFVREGGGNMGDEAFKIVGKVLSIGVWLTLLFSITIILAARFEPIDKVQNQNPEHDNQE